MQIQGQIQPFQALVSVFTTSEKPVEEGTLQVAERTFLYRAVFLTA